MHRLRAKGTTDSHVTNQFCISSTRVRQSMCGHRLASHLRLGTAK